MELCQAGKLARPSPLRRKNKGKADTLEMKRILGGFIKKRFRGYLIGLLAIVVSGILQILIPKQLGYVMDMFEAGQSRRAILLSAALFLVLSAALFFSKFVYRRYIMGMSRDLESCLRLEMFSHIQRVPVTFFHTFRTGSLLSYLTNDLKAIKSAFAVGIVFLVEGVVINLFSVAVMAQTIHPALAFAIVIPFALAILMVLYTKKIIGVRFSAFQKSLATLSGKIQENISGIRIVKAFAQERREVESIERVSRERLSSFIEYARISSALQPGIQIFVGISYMLVVAIGGTYVMNGTITVGDFVATNIYVGLLAAPLSQLAKIIETWQRAAVSARRLDQVFRYPLEEDAGEPGIQIGGEIEIRDLSFRYPHSQRYVFKNLSLKIRQGESLGIVGRLGSGKTTLLQLLLKIYPVERGHIFIGGADINDISARTLRSAVGYVPQEPTIFSDTIARNIKFFNDEISDGEVLSASKAACIYDDIMDLPDGFETQAGEQGVMLSGGQKQRIAIARALIRKPRIALLDDCMSAVDIKTENRILSNLGNALSGVTSIVIAHRVSVVMEMDRIVVLDDGVVLEEGTHRQLMRAGGAYCRLYREQMPGERAAGREGAQDKS